MNQLVAELDGLAEDLARDGATGVETVASASRQLARLERENTELRNEIARLNSQTNWVCKCGGTDCEGQKENAAMRKALAEADELERYSGSDGHRQWGKCSAWLHPDDAVVIISAKALDAARKEAQP